MKDKKLQELIQLYVLGELDNSDKAELEKHLESSEQARLELENLQSMLRNISENKPEELNDDVLITSRQSLLRQIRIEGSVENYYTKILRWLEQINVNGFKLAATMRPDQRVLINLSGRGDKDVQTVAELEGLSL